MCGLQGKGDEDYDQATGPWNGPTDAVSLHRLQWRG